MVKKKQRKSQRLNCQWLKKNKGRTKGKGVNGKQSFEKNETNANLIWSTVMMICILIFSVKLIFCWCQFFNILSVYLIVTSALVCVFEELFFQCNSTPKKIIIDKKRHNCNFTNKAINVINLQFVNDAKHFIYLFVCPSYVSR